MQTKKDCYLQELEKKRKAAGDTRSALTVELENTVSMQHQMSDDMLTKDFPMEKYFSYFDKTLVKNRTKDAKKHRRGSRITFFILVAYCLSVTLWLCSANPEAMMIFWGMYAAMDGYLLFLINDNMQRDVYRKLCREEIPKLAEKAKNLEKRIARYQAVEQSIQNAMNEINASFAHYMAPDLNPGYMEEVIHEFAPKLVFTYPQEENR